MKIKAIEINNFRGIEKAQITGVGDLVIVAGPNGSGKSCILDAIRLTKSIYGGYQANEWNLWMNEFKIERRGTPEERKKLLRHEQRAAQIKIGIELSDREIEYLREKKNDLMEGEAFVRLAPGQTIDQWYRIKAEGGANRLDPQLREALDLQTRRLVQALEKELGHLMLEAQVSIDPVGRIQKGESLALEAVWRTYEPNRVGIIDYHGSHRDYAREQIAGVKLDLAKQEDKEKQHTLYNYGQKYVNIKAEMAAEFVRDVLQKEGGGGERRGRNKLENTLKELFGTFFPGKQFQGATADEFGNIEFPVTVGEAQHDMNDLSSGEKEILYGYLKLRRSAWKDSIILIDEPELHLNPKLIQGLPQFYQRHICR